MTVDAYPLARLSDAITALDSLGGRLILSDARRVSEDPPVWTQAVINHVRHESWPGDPFFIPWGDRQCWPGEGRCWELYDESGSNPSLLNCIPLSRDAFRERVADMLAVPG